MPWKETVPVEQRMRFVLECQDAQLSMAVLCRKYGVSRRIGYKWWQRYEAEGIQGLQDRSRAPHTHPQAVPDEIESAILAARGKHPTWGPKKLLSWLQGQKPPRCWPARSTMAEILDRHGLTVPRKRRRRVEPQEQPFADCQEPNGTWCADFKGWFRTGDGQRCDPLTITDAFSRYLLRCQRARKTDTLTVHALFEAAFREYGLPWRIRTDNGAPFASRAIGGLSALSVWWLKLGIAHERIEPGQPQQNGRHERMHLTLKNETACPPAATLRRQQQRFDAFRREFNEDRPHEALGMATPGSVYTASARAYPERLGELTYPSDWLVRRVCDRGELRWQGSKVFVTRVLDGELVGLEAMDERYWRLWLGPRALGVLDGRRQRLLTGRELRVAGWSELLLGRAFRCATGPAQEPLNVLPMSPD